MAKPTAGSNYTVVSGDQIKKIARQAYGYDNSTKIVGANTELLKGRDDSLEGLPYIYKGDVLWLPESATSLTETVDASTDDEIAIKLDGKVFRGWTASNISRNINTVADAFAFTLPYDYTDATLREKTKPYAYKSADLYIGGELYIAGQQVKWSTALSIDSTVKTIDVRTKAGHTVECMAQKQALEYNGSTLSEIAIDIMEPYGDDLEPIFEDGDSDSFTKVRKEMVETDFEFLSGLAAQKGFMITSSDTGQMSFIRAATSGKPVFKFVEGESAIEHLSSSYDGTGVFSSITAITEVAGTSGTSSNLTNELVNAYRPFVFSADDLESGNLETALKWKRSKALADSAGLSMTVTGWRNMYDQLWRENMIGTVYAPSVDILEETSYIVSGVNLVKDENGGNVTKLTLVLPQAYTLDYPDSFPWEE